MYARNLHTDKVVADTVVAGFMKVFEAETLENAIEIFENLANPGLQVQRRPVGHHWQPAGGWMRQSG